MPNPSTIAAEMDDKTRQQEAEVLDEVETYFAQLMPFAGMPPYNPEDDGSPGEPPAYVEFEAVAVPEGTSDDVIKMLEALEDELATQEMGSVMVGEMMVEACEQLAVEEDKVSALTKSLAVLGQQLVEMTESRDRAKAYNSDSVEEVRAGRRIAEAAARFLDTRKTFDLYEAALADGDIKGSIPDSVVEAVASAEASLETLLIDGKYIEG